MRKILLLTFAFTAIIAFRYNAIAQNAVGIGTTSPNPNSSLTLGQNDKGLQLNRVDTTSLFGSLGVSDHGLIVYDSVRRETFIWTGTKFSKIGGSEAGGEPVGTIMSYAGASIPSGYLLCDGSAISRTTFSDLFAEIGTTWGEGDGSTTFHLPG